MKIKKSILIVCALIWGPVEGKTYDFANGMQFDIRGYAGWRQIFSDVQFDSIPSAPELGLATSLKVTDRLNIFNQFKYGTTLSNVLVYNQINYTPYIPIDSLELTLNGGRVWYDNNLYNITRVNPRTRQGVFQPQAIYWDTLARSITSGDGIGFDLKYKDFNMSYIIDKQITTNKNTEARAWTTYPINRMSSTFGNHQMVAVGFDFPEYGIRTKASWNHSLFNITNKPKNININDFIVEYFFAGVEWTHNKWIVAVETINVRDAELSWADRLNKNYGASGTITYELCNYVDVRFNFNQYVSAPRPPLQADYRSQANRFKDVNFGFNFHTGPWMANVEMHWMQGARIVDPSNYVADPQSYTNYYVVGTNLVYFFE